MNKKTKIAEAARVREIINELMNMSNFGSDQRVIAVLAYMNERLIALEKKCER